MYVIMYREEGHARKTLTYNTEKGMMKKLDELNNDPLIISIRIFKEITYGDQQNLFDAKNSPF